MIFAHPPGQAKLARRALQQGHAKPFLERRHAAADGGDGHAECVRRAAEALELRDPHEDDDIIQIGL